MVARTCSNGRWLEPFPLELYRSPSGDRNGKYYRDREDRHPRRKKESADGEQRWWPCQWWVGACCWPGMSQRIRRSPGGGFCRSFRTLGARRSTCNLAGAWASRPSRCGSCRSRPGEGWRWFAWKPRTPSGRWASLRHRRRLSTRGTAGAMRKLFGFDLARLARAGSGELLFTWRDGGPGEREAPKSPWPDTPAHQT